MPLTRSACTFAVEIVPLALFRGKVASLACSPADRFVCNCRLPLKLSAQLTGLSHFLVGNREARSVQKARIRLGLGNDVCGRVSVNCTCPCLYRSNSEGKVYAPNAPTIEY